jgi:hypothetical protein
MRFAFLWFRLVCIAAIGSVAHPQVLSAQEAPAASHRELKLQGWTVRVHEDLYRSDGELTERALELLEMQLQEIVRVVPEPAVRCLQRVPLWFSPEYPNTQPGAEYHPDAAWLSRNQRDPVMAQSVEFTNIRIFERETRRMPNFALHELAHAYHDQFLDQGFRNQAIQQAFDQTKRSGTYQSVEQRFGDGRTATVEAYAMKTPQEYFAESTEAYFSTNDFFPFDRSQLGSHDPRMLTLLEQLWQVPKPAVEVSCEDLQADWKHHGEIWIDTTQQAAQLDADVTVIAFPLLIHLHSDFFPFEQSQTLGEDLRFCDDNGLALPYEIETWQPKAGMADVWVLAPEIRGAERRRIHMHWGNPRADAKSNSQAVFGRQHGFCSVLHLGETLSDAADDLSVASHDTTPIAARIGIGRSFSPGSGITVGEELNRFPVGSEPHSTEAWVRVRSPNQSILGWGNEKAQGKLVLQYRSPSRINWDCYFSNANIATESMVPCHVWTHVAHVYTRDRTQLFINGLLAAESNSKGSPLNLKKPLRFWLGGWYGNNEYDGDLDEVRISHVARSPAWYRLQYENLREHQRLVSPLVTAGDAFRVEPTEVLLDEEGVVRLQATATGAQKISWSWQCGELETALATDRLTCEFKPGRVEGDLNGDIVIRALYPEGMRTLRVPVMVRETKPDPNLGAWVVRKDPENPDALDLAIELNPTPSRSLAPVDDVRIEWEVTGVSTIHRIEGNRLSILRSLGTGDLNVSVRVSNGGAWKHAETTIPLSCSTAAERPWVPRTIGPTEAPIDGQFIPREGRWHDGLRQGHITLAGNVAPGTERIELRVYSKDPNDPMSPERLVTSESTQPDSRGDYQISAPIRAALVKYRYECFAVTGTQSQRLHEAKELMCGDVFVIQGQSNSVATDFGPTDHAEQSPWVVSYGSSDANPQAMKQASWGTAKTRVEGGHLQIGYWGVLLGNHLVASQQIPICILNGAVGGSRIDQHQRSRENPNDHETIYGRLLSRLEQSQLTHGVRGVFWYQGENDQAADGPTNRFGYETYSRDFATLTAAWNEDLPNIEHHFVFQIWPHACSMGFNGSDNRLREVQRQLPKAIDNLSVMSTLGIQPPGGCHYPAAGYAELARLIAPIVEQKLYHQRLSESRAAPNLRRILKDPNAPHRIRLELDIPVVWDDRIKSQFRIDGKEGQVTSGQADGNSVWLQIDDRTDPTTVTYVDSARWSPEFLLRSTNGVAALTFWNIAVETETGTPTDPKR